MLLLEEPVVNENADSQQTLRIIAVRRDVS